MLTLYVLVGASEEKVAVELPVEATVGDLKAAVHAAGGPPPHNQVLAFGAEEMRAADTTLLSDTHLVSNEAVVGVRQRTRHRQLISVSEEHGLAILEDGGVVGWGCKTLFEPMPDFGGCVVSVHASKRINAAVVADGRLVTWGPVSSCAAGAKPLADAEVVCCSVSDAGVVAAVDSKGNASFFMPSDPETEAGSECPERMRGRVAAVSCGVCVDVLLSREGTVAAIETFTEEVTWAKLGGRRAVSVAVGLGHYVVLLDDGSVRCFGWEGTSHRQVPEGLSEVASVAACPRGTAVLFRSGTVACWGEGLDRLYIKSAAPCVAVACARGVLAAVTADGKVECNTNSSSQDSNLEDTDFGGRRVRVC